MAKSNELAQLNSEQERFFRDLLSHIQEIDADTNSLRAYAQRVEQRADAIDSLTHTLEYILRKESDRLGIDPFEVKEF